MLQQVPDLGSFTSRNKSIINANFAALQQIDVYVRPQYGNNLGKPSSSYPLGSYENPYASMAGVSSLLRPGLVIGLEGVLFEEYSSPRVNGITIVGLGNYPVQATSGGIPNGGGATWMSPSGGTGALLQPNGQGWCIRNLFMNNADTADGCVKLVNAGDPPTANCSEKFSAIGCFFTGTDDGINAVDNPNNILIDGCTFFGFSGASDLAISTATGLGTGTLQNWVIQNCDFLGNTGHITAPFSAAIIRNNHFSYIWGSTTTTTQVVLTSGANNSIYNNRFDVPFNVNGLTAMFASGTNDRWGANSMGTAVLTPMTGLLWGVPVSGAA
jgi:hypothetical protein